MELSEELIAKAKGTKTPEELAALAKESSIDTAHDKSMREVYGLDKTLRE